MIQQAGENLHGAQGQLGVKVKWKRPTIFMANFLFRRHFPLHLRDFRLTATSPYICVTSVCTATISMSVLIMIVAMPFSLKLEERSSE